MAIPIAAVLILAGCGDKTTSPDETADAPLEAGPDAETTPTAVAEDSGAPTADEIDRARRLLDAYERASAAGVAAIDFEGQMVDEPLAAQARRIIAVAGQVPKGR